MIIIIIVMIVIIIIIVIMIVMIIRKIVLSNRRILETKKSVDLEENRRENDQTKTLNLEINKNIVTIIPLTISFIKI